MRSEFPYPDYLHPERHLSLQFLGEYRLMRCLGQGGMSEVFLAYDAKAGTSVAIKMLAEHFSADPVQRTRFEREAELLTTLQHRNIIRGRNWGFDEESGRHFLVMEYIDGPSAEARVEQLGRLSVPDVVHIGLAMARALEHLHGRNYIHRDIKPSNILLAPDGHARLTDFGLVKWNDREAVRLTAANDGFGTSYYMPLEQALNAHFVDGRSDIFALGATLYHLLAGRVPFPGEDHSDVVRMKRAGIYTPISLWNSTVPTKLEAILNRMLAIDPRKRYRSATDVLVALERTHLAGGMPSYTKRERGSRSRAQQEEFLGLDKTCPDLRLQAPGFRPHAPEFWFLRYRNRKGQLQLRKGSTEQVLQALRSGRFRGPVLAARCRLKNFRPLSEYPEFHAYFAASPPSQPVPISPPQNNSTLCRRLMARIGWNSGAALSR
jgi:serine/threonine-protein kinase